MSRKIETQRPRPGATREEFINRKSKFLSHVPLLRSLSDLQRDRLADAMEEVSFQPGETIVRQSELGKSMFFVVSGPFPSFARPIWTEIPLCHACSCQEILRAGTARQESGRAEAYVDGAPMVVYEPGQVSPKRPKTAASMRRRVRHSPATAPQ